MALNGKPTPPQRCLLESVARIGTTDAAKVFADCGLRGAAFTKVLAACTRNRWLDAKGRLTAAGRAVIA